MKVNILNKKEDMGLDRSFGFVIIKTLNHTVFLRANGRRQFFYEKSICIY